jgi:hypothetical protein
MKAGARSCAAHDGDDQSSKASNSRPSSEANPPWLDNDESSVELRSVLPHEIHDESRQTSARGGREPQQDDAGCRLRRCEDELSEIPVFCNQHTLLADCHLDDNIVLGAGRDFSHGTHIVAGVPQCSHHSEIRALVRQKAHSRLGFQ